MAGVAQCFGYLKNFSAPRFSRQLSRVVSSHNEWDPLEEIIVGRIDDPKVPPLTRDIKACLPRHKWEFFQKNAGKSFPSEVVANARKEVENLCSVLEGEGVAVRRPDKVATEKSFSTPDFDSSISYFNANPRDLLMVVGDKLIEAPMAKHCRYFEFLSYRTLIKEYFKEGAEWIAAPKPAMSEELFSDDYPLDDPETRIEWTKKGKFITTEFEPCFDAADFLRCGKDIIGQRSHVTNFSGIEWLQRQLGDTYKIHKLYLPSIYTVHIDASIFIPKPGVVVFNPTLQSPDTEFFEKAGWKVLMAPEPTTRDEYPMFISSPWLSINTLMLDTKRVIVEAQEYPTQKFFESIGLECIKVPFRNCYAFGGGIHCFTCDIRRRGELESYF